MGRDLRCAQDVYACIRKWDLSLKSQSKTIMIYNDIDPKLYLITGSLLGHLVLEVGDGRHVKI